MDWRRLVSSMVTKHSISLKDNDFDINGVELILNFMNIKQTDDTIVADIDIALKFGVQCSHNQPGGSINKPQEVLHEVRWTSFDVDSIENCVHAVCEDIQCNTSKTSDVRRYKNLWLMEPEVEGLYVYNCGDPNIEFYFSCGLNAVGSTIRLWTTMHNLQQWVKEILDYFYKAGNVTQF